MASYILPGAVEFIPSDQFTYWNFFLDWGPLSLGNLYRFCRTLNFKLRSDKHMGKVIYVYSEAHPHKRTNAAFLLCAWQLLYRHKTPEEALLPFRGTYPPFPPFHDASPGACTYNLTVLDCLKGLSKACYFRFFDFNTFNIEEYEHYEQVENGDFNWLVDGKFLAFAGPHRRSEITKEGYHTLTPGHYIPYFKKHNVTLVIRLNKKYYDEKQFVEAGIAHKEAYFIDGGVPPLRVLQDFIAVCEASPGAIAVHCKAGLGRTGTCIGCYLMKHYGFTAAEIIGWMRICRPGSVIGHQQQFLQQMEAPMHREGIVYREMIDTSSSRYTTAQPQQHSSCATATRHGRRDSANERRRVSPPPFPTSPGWSISHGNDPPSAGARASQKGALSRDTSSDGVHNNKWSSDATRSNKKMPYSASHISSGRREAGYHRSSSSAIDTETRGDCPDLEDCGVSRDFTRLKVQGGVAAVGTGATSKGHREDQDDKIRRRRKSAPAVPGNVDAVGSTKLGVEQKYVADKSALSPRRPDRSRPVSERLADVAESLEAAAAADTFASTRYYQQRPVGLVSARTLSTGRRSTSVDSAWERTRAKEGGRSLGGKTQGDILLERRVAHRAGDRSRG